MYLLLQIKHYTLCLLQNIYSIAILVSLESFLTSAKVFISSSYSLGPSY